MSFHTKNIRNVALLGHSGTGKTTFSECMLFESGAITRRGNVADGNTASDYTNIEKERKNSLFSSLMNVNWKDSKINIIDTPGYDDFVGEVVSTLKVADTAVVLVNAANGVEVGTELIWESVQKHKTPAIFVVNQIDHGKSDYDMCLSQLQARFGNQVIPFQFPLNEGEGCHEIVDALRMVLYDFSADGGKPTKKETPESVMERAQEMHNALVEAAAENDEGLMEKFFDAGTLNEEELAEGLRIALAEQQIFPVFCCSAENNMGSGRVMGFLHDIAPSPAHRPAAPLRAEGETITCTADGPCTAFIYKTISEPNVGNVSYIKVYSGSLKSGEEVRNATNGKTERINQLYTSNGKNRTPVDEIKAGDIAVTVKLKNSHTNQTLLGNGQTHEIEPIHFPDPRVRVAVRPPAKKDIDKLVKAFHTLQEEDPTLIVEQSKELGQTILHGQGQLHLDLTKYRISKVYNIDVEYDKPKIPYRETITGSADTVYRHKKQSGGSGQFAEVHMRIEPYTEDMPAPEGLTVRSTDLEELPWGGHMSFYWCIVGGSIDSKYINAIKKGILLRMADGPLTGSYCRDVRVSIYDGKMHSVDSNDMAFQIASSAAFKDAFHKANPQIMEPVYNLEVLCSDEVMGDVMSDLQTRRGIIQGMDSDGHYQKISAHVPLAEMYQYSASLRSISQGRAKFARSFSHYAPVPYDVQQKLITEQQELVAAGG